MQGYQKFHFFPESTSRAAYSVVSYRTMSKFERMQAFMYALIPYKYYKNRIINSREKVEKSFLPLLVYGDFFRRSKAAYSTVDGRIWLKFELVRDFMHVLVNCKYKK